MSEHRFRLSVLKEKAVLDADGNDLGDIIDAVMDSGKGYLITHLIIGGGFIEELLEAMNKRADIDEYFDLSDIREVLTDTIKLSICEADLMRTNKDGSLPAPLVRFSSILRKPVVDKGGEQIGEIVDLEFSENKTSLILLDFEFNRQINYEHRYGQRVLWVVDISEFQINGEQITANIEGEERMHVLLENLKPRKRGIDYLRLG